LENCVEIVNKVCGIEIEYDAALVNWYGPNHSIGKHADNEKQLRPNCPIFSFSWGDTRRFLIYAMKGGPCIKTYKLEHGDLFVMGGNLQKTHKHAIEKVKKKHDSEIVKGKRINFTIRAIVN
jgi:alkylated DNA repair dioxygenase AlkB